MTQKVDLYFCQDNSDFLELDVVKLNSQLLWISPHLDLSTQWLTHSGKQKLSFPMVGAKEWFNSIYWVKKGKYEDSRLFFSTFGNRKQQLIAESETEVLNKKGTKTVNFYSGELMKLVRMLEKESTDIIIGLDLTYFTALAGPKTFSLEVSKISYEAVKNDQYHPLRYAYKTIDFKIENGRYYFCFNANIDELYGTVRDELWLKLHLEKVINEIKKINPYALLVSRSTNGLVPEDQWKLCEQYIKTQFS